jgi:pimeloyl-ACP methyl ester carboxylesterase
MTGRNNKVEYGRDTLSPGIRSRYVDNNNGVTMHVLEAGFDGGKRPCVVLLHGFPELGYTWRNQLLPLAAAGFHVIAPDLRGYGRSAHGPVRFSDDLRPYELLNRVTDVLGLVRALGYDTVDTVIGHHWGSPTAAWCAVVRPDVFRSVVLIGTPFGGTGAQPLDTASRPGPPSADELKAFAGRTIDVPALFIGGANEWGPRQSPGALEAMQKGACTRLLGVHFVDKTGHSIPEEQPEQVNRLLIEFLHRSH